MFRIVRPALSLFVLSLALAGAGCPHPKPTPAARRAARAAAVDPHLIPRKVIFGNPKRAGLQLSPDGLRLGFLAPVKGVMNVWVQTVGKDDAKPVTHDTYRGVHGYFWTPDSTAILYAQDKGGDENYRIYAASVPGGAVRRLTPDKGVRASVVEVNRYHPHTILVSMNQRDPHVFDVYRLDLRSGKLTPDTQNPGNVVSWVSDRNLQVRAALAMSPTGDKLLLARTSPKDPWKTLRTWSPLESGAPIAFTYDGAEIFAIGNKGSDKTRLYKIRVSDGKITEIFASKEGDLTGVSIHPKDRHVEAVSIEYLTKKWVAIDPKFQADLDALGRLAKGNRFGIVNRTLDDKRWIVAVGGPTLPARYYLYERPARTFRLLLATRPDLRRFALAPMKPVLIPARDGMKLVCYLTRPPRPLPGKQPMVLFVHGGPWSRDKWSYHPWVQWLANRGYVVLQVNFRGSAGFGKRYLNAGNREWGRKMQHDLTDAVRWVLAHLNVDPKRVGILGGSYGGYATLAGVTFTPALYAAAVDIVGPSSILTLLKSIPPYWKPLMTVFKTRVGDPVADKEMLRKRSPLYFADRIRTPLAIFQGANDPRVKIAESNQIVAAIRKRKGQVLYVVYPDEGHGFRRAPNRLDFLARTERFLARHLGGRLEPLSRIPGATARVR